MLVDDEDRVWLFIGSRISSYAYHNRMIRLDSQLNLDFEEYILHSNSIASGYQLDWEDVTIDSNGNVLAKIYTSSSSVYWDGEYISYQNSYQYRTWFFMDSISHNIDGASFISGEPVSFGVTGLSAVTGGNSYVDGTEYLSASDTTNYTDTYFIIGGWYNTDYLMDGYIDEFRMTLKARYTSNFTAPTKEFANL